ncbi:MAG: sensor histidine kinase [Candidatus Izimaplasma sp.]|nr:sensor histidine kinase [Candidatus Izimaplasma bacterium]
MKWFKQLSIDRKLNYAVILLLSTALLFASAFIYINTYNTVDEIVEANSKEINKQIILNYENYFNDVRDLANYIELKTKEVEIANQESLHEIYSNVATLNSDTITISLVKMDGTIAATSKLNYSAYEDLTERYWFDRAIDNEEVYFFSTPHPQDVFVDSNEQVISVSKQIDYYEYSQKYSGVLLIELSTEQIDTLAKQTNLGENGHLIIISDKNQLIYSSTDKCQNSTCDSNVIARKIIIGGDFVSIDGTDMYVSINTIHGTRWRIATFINVDLIGSSKISIFFLLSTVLVVTIFISTLIASILTKQITRPLNKLKEHMTDIQHSDHLYKEVEVRGQKEVVILAAAYNEMIKEIRGLMNQLVDEQNEKRKTELIALQTQINPHFLYNTLDSIIWLSEQNDNEHVIEMVMALSRFFRISISRGKDIITIDKEIQHAKYYLKIQTIRYSNKFEYTVNVEESIKDKKVVKLILQPIIENAIHHGISTEFKGQIDISVYKKDGFIYFEVMNNGYGLTDEQIEEIYEKIQNDNHESIGLKNVVQRLKLYYGERSGIHIKSVLDESTTIQIYFPLEKG